MAKNLRKRKIVCTSCCFVCKKAGEDVDLLLLHCDTTMRLWWDMFRWFRTSWVMPKLVKDLMFCWRSGRGEDRGDGTWFDTSGVGGCDGRDSGC